METGMDTVLVEQSYGCVKISVNSISHELCLEVESKYQLLQSFTFIFRKIHMYESTFMRNSKIILTGTVS